MTEQQDVHTEGRRLVADIIRRKQEAEAWDLWHQDQLDLERERVAVTLDLDTLETIIVPWRDWTRANPPLTGRPARIEWP